MRSKLHKYPIVLTLLLLLVMHTELQAGAAAPPVGRVDLRGQFAQRVDQHLPTLSVPLLQRQNGREPVELLLLGTCRE